MKKKENEKPLEKAKWQLIHNGDNQVLRKAYSVRTGYCSYLYRNIHIFKDSRDPGCLNADRSKNNYPLKDHLEKWIWIMRFHILRWIHIHLNIHITVFCGFGGGQQICTTLNPSLLLKDTFRVSVSFQEPSGLGLKEDFRKNLSFSMSILSISYLYWMYVSMNNVKIFHDER